MLEMIRARKEQFKAEGKKGFTLMEMMIAIAIITVLIAIAIPIFTSQLENIRGAATISNIRSAYAEASATHIPANGKDMSQGKVTVDGAAKQRRLRALH